MTIGLTDYYTITMSVELKKDDNIRALERLQAMGHIDFKGNLHNWSSDNIQIRCPYHRDKAPSLRIELSRGVWFCHSCKREGNVDMLCVYLAGLPSRELLGITTPFDYKSNIQRIETKPPEFHPIMILGFTYPALEIRATYSYLKKRKIQDNVVLGMGMMYSPECHINGQHMIERLLIPMYNKNDNLINVEGRSLDPANNHPKVLYPKNLPKPLYEDHKLDRQKPLYLVEGLMDLARLREDSRFANSTATFGTGLSDYQRSCLNMFDKIILIPDNDKPGEDFVETLKGYFKDKFSVLRIKDTSILDVGAIPTHITEFYNNNGFISNTSFSF